MTLVVHLLFIRTAKGLVTDKAETRPGGMYFIEDLVSSRPELRSYFADGPESTVTKILKWQETLMLEDLPATGKFDIQGLQSIECFRGMCAFFKCSLDQHDCP
mgnify:CR=1 FL=1